MFKKILTNLLLLRRWLLQIFEYIKLINKWIDKQLLIYIFPKLKGNIYLEKLFFFILKHKTLLILIKFYVLKLFIMCIIYLLLNK